MLAVVREPVTIDQLQKWTKQDHKHIRRAITQWREFLEVSQFEDEKKYRVYHTSFQEFLEKQVDLKNYDEIIVQNYLEDLGMA